MVSCAKIEAMRCFLFTLFLLFFPVFSQASQTKSKVLTDSNLMVEDESQVFVFPSSASRFKNKMSIQVNGEKPEENPIYSGQIIYQLNDNFFLATVLSDQREAPDFPDQEIKYPDKKYHFLLSHKNNKREMAAQIYFGLSRNAKEEKEGKKKK